MGYTTNEQVKQLFNNLDISKDTAISEDTIGQFIIDSDALIDARLRKFYSVPIVELEDLKYISIISKLLVASQINSILVPTEEKDSIDKQKSKAMRMLEDIAPSGRFKDIKEGSVDMVVKLNTALLSGGLFRASQGIPIFTKEDAYGKCQ